MTRLDRRALFSSGAAAALLAATGVSLEASPRQGGRLRIALPRSDDNLARLAHGAAFDTLTEIAPNGGLKGELATGWRAEALGRIWVIDLREGVTFHDGTTMRATDVVESLTGTLDLARRIEATGEMQVQIELAEARPDLPFVLAAPDLAIARSGQVGTGCYRTERLVPDRQYLGRKVQDHYKFGRAGWVDTVEAVVIPDATVRAEALRDGFVDIAAVPGGETLRGYADLVFYPSSDNMALAMRKSVGRPREIGAGLLDDGRLAERWWLT
ncbi:ABC transporter substrate-binding protein [Sedimentitalea todarodis]|uniref:ABC transporter substrate-binding protein n=1 Tax=Sedimentitalea todarodis TaxID=1631240 RepID=A0ABU3VEY0_9RHOB|nr:ABC transporter substrate-binding protein [Sedimentitalea todarodis]MDU9004274.1 ABC transporter substrate-binding protein [Sedimentitalea todarodis]